MLKETVMNITLPWGQDKLELTLPETWQVVFPKAQDVQQSSQKRTETDIVQSSLHEPFESQSLEKMQLKDKFIVIVVDDNTRPTPAFKFFDLILESLLKAGASFDNILLIPALGIHTAMTAKEMQEKVGEQNLKNIKWENHDAFNKDTHHYFGKTGRGTPVWLNKKLAEADLIISIGMVEPHLWAGFGGGLKNLLPGLAYSETIGIHHSIIAEPPYLFNRVGMAPGKNSFRQDIEEIKGMLKAPVFCVNVVIDHAGTIIASFAGDPIRCHRKAIEHNIKVSGRYLDEPVDAVIVNSCPMDLNFKQSMKGVANTLPAVKPGGIIIGFLKADRGIDDIKLPEKGKSLRLVKTILRIIGPSRVLGFLDLVRKGLNIEERFLIYYSLQLMRQYDLYFYAPSISREEAKKLGFFIISHDPQKTINIAAGKIPCNGRVAVFPEAGATFPIMR
jgi:lactate racemase